MTLKHKKVADYFVSGIFGVILLRPPPVTVTRRSWPVVPLLRPPAPGPIVGLMFSTLEPSLVIAPPITRW